MKGNASRGTGDLSTVPPGFSSSVVRSPSLWGSGCGNMGYHTRHFCCRQPIPLHARCQCMYALSNRQVNVVPPPTGTRIHSFSDSRSYPSASKGEHADRNDKERSGSHGVPRLPYYGSVASITSLSVCSVDPKASPF